MGSESGAAIEALAAESETMPLSSYESTQPDAYEDGAIDSDLKASDATEFDSFLSSGDGKFKADTEDTHKSQAVPADVPNGDTGSGWLHATPPEGNGSGWISADGVPVTLPPPVSSQPWPSSRQQRTVYLTRIPRSVDEKLRNEIKLAEAKVEQTIKKRDVHKTALQAKKNSKMELLEKLKPIRDKERACRDALQGKRMELEPFSLALNKFRNAQNRGQDICSSEEELNDKIADIQFRIQHESIPLKEEKQLLREIKQLESTRSQVCANSVLQAELMENLGPKEDIQDQHKFLRQDLDSIRKEHRQARAEYDAMDSDINKLNEAIEELRQQYEKANAVQQDAYAVMRELKRQENLKNDPFYQNKRDVQVVRELASQKKLKEVEDICTKQVEDFLVMWNKDSTFRAEYMKSNERSTVRRLETLDGRSLGPNEKPPVVTEADALLPMSRDAKSALDADTTTSGPFKAAKLSNSGVVGPELSNGVLVKETKQGRHLPVHLEDEEAGDAGNRVNTKLRQMDVGEDSVDSESQAAERKERMRQEQIAKAKEAEERKKKRSDKLESRAIARARKDAERKEKEREKKAQKKAAASSSAVADLNEGSDLSEVNPEAYTEPAVAIPEEGSKSTVSSSNKDRKGAVTQRKLTGKNVKPSKVMLSKRSSKKAAWPVPIWAIASIAALVLLVAFILFMKL